MSPKKRSLEMENPILTNFYIYAFLLLAFFFLHCGRENCQELEKEWSHIIGDSFISRGEFEKFSQKTKNYPECKYPSNPCGLETFQKRKHKDAAWEISQCSTSSPNLRVYMENSDSMDGYIQGGKSFRDNIAHLLIRLKAISSGSEFSFINGNIFPLKQSLETFTKELNPPSPNYYKYKSNTFGSDLNSIFKRIIHNLKKDEIAVFITDGIYSIANSDNIQTELQGSKNFTMDTFIDGIREKNLVTIVIQMESNFVGNYYDMRHTPHSIRSTKPFYIFLLGSEELLLPIWNSKKVEVLKNPGIRNYSVFFKDFPNEVPRILLSQYKKVGKKKIIDRKKNIISAIHPSTEGLFSISVAVDLNELHDEKKITEDPKNYTYPDACELEIDSFNESVLDVNDKIFMKKFSGTPTHIFNLICNKEIIPNEKITITLERNKTNLWWHTGSLSIDVQPSAWSDFKTFGLSYLLDGIADAYSEFASAGLIFSIPIFLENR